MEDTPLWAWLLVLGLLVLIAAFFAGTETALMSLNRYRLRHLAKAGHRGARYAEILLQRMDRLIGTILLGNLLAIEGATIVTTLLTNRLLGEAWLAAAGGALMFTLLIFGEIAPKTLGALHPERVALPAAYVYMGIRVITYPLVWFITVLSNGMLRLVGVSPEQAAEHSISTEELRTVVAEAGAMIPQRHQKMLLSLLDLEKATVEDIMVPRNEIVGVDLTDPPDRIRQQLVQSQHTRLPLVNGSIDDLRGIIHLRNALTAIVSEPFDPQNLLKLAREPYFIPEGTPLNQQLLNFQNQKRRIGFVVDEYGDIQGLVTLADILEEVVGEFTSDPATRVKNVTMENDGSYLVNGGLTIRSLNRTLGWRLPTAGPRTVNGLVLEQLEDIPKPGKQVRVRDYTIEITETHANAVRTARIRPPAEPAKLGEEAAA
ncbi:MAG TPA: HlyC/CorC family transporter [Candidatus Binatia bacterium]|nr:HlyC/CorC family transporter [Candidatus Binatia bacterium]